MFEHTWDGHLGRIKIAKHFIDLTSTDIQPVTPHPTLEDQKHENSKNGNLLDVSNELHQTFSI